MLIEPIETKNELIFYSKLKVSFLQSRDSPLIKPGFTPEQVVNVI